VTREALRAAIDRPITMEELHAAVDGVISDEERANALALVAWFRRRYPTGVDRLAYVRRAFLRWQRTAERE
jgi:hypothetical protein